MKARNITITALLTAVALIMFVVEAQIPSVTFIPGIKLGLSNIVTVFAMYFLGPWSAFCVMIIRVTLGCLATGQMMAFAYSIAGGFLAFFVSRLLYKSIPADRVWIVSIFAAIAHNIGQVAAAILITSTAELLYYLPVLIASAIITGAFTGVCAKLLLKRLNGKFLNKY